MSGDGREGGWIRIWRKLRSSALWKSLRADQKGVTVTLLLLANWKPAPARWRGQFFEVRRGELAHSLEEIADEAGCTVKVVRTTLVALMADDRASGGNGPFVTERYPIPGTRAGTGPRVLRIEKYEDYQPGTEVAGTDTGVGRARTGHGSGTDRAEREEGEEVEEREEGGAGGAAEAWSKLVARVQPRLRPDLWDRWFAPLTARVVGAELLVEAPDRFHRDFVDDNHRPWLQEVLLELGVGLELRIVARSAGASPVGQLEIASGSPAPLRAAGGS